ncbi:hypothetical protein GCM10011395_19630 [Sphingomonas psychrolutea]|uniref:Uncharacterized protein n=1 Tax=Sphingomonas psychrolutea TaxID=1259676 RepID=A0ABQ1GSB3_9SPHN|nr:hypothetical protein GCM10011395_19630 [Sphingomonas psychrolutea]
MFGARFVISLSFKTLIGDDDVRLGLRINVPVTTMSVFGVASSGLATVAGATCAEADEAKLANARTEIAEPTLKRASEVAVFFINTPF